MILRCLILVVLALLPALARAQGFETAAPAAWVFDQTTGTILLAKNADEPRPPASMSKLMTIYLAFEAIAEGRLTVDTVLPVSAHAASFDGSSMFLDTTDRVRVEDLLRGVIVLSGNDASVVLAEALSPDGTEAGFAQMMTDKARDLGMMNSHFVNASGWPAAGHVMSLHDLGILADRLIRDFPTFYPLFAEQEFLFDGRVPSNTQNRNPILSLGVGADGLKTGHTEDAGFGLVGSARQGDRRIIFVIAGLESADQRRSESERILNWAFRQFALREVGAEGQEFARAGVWMGGAADVGLVLPQDVSLLVPEAQGGVPGIAAEVSFASPVQAPVLAGQEMGHLVITRPGLPEVRLPLVAAGTVEVGGFGVRVGTAADVLARKFGLDADAAPDAAPVAIAEPAADAG